MFKINSHYQPIVSLAHRRVVGFEALLRAQSDHGEACSPLMAFEEASKSNSIARFDRHCLINHVTEFKKLNTLDQWLFVNLNSVSINPKNMRSRVVINQLQKLNIQPHNIVLEILEDAAKDTAQLKAFVNYYRSYGFLIAIDDFGTGHSNFDRIWELKPNIVKLDRSMLANARKDHARLRWLGRCVDLLRETGALITIEGVETQDDALIALDADVDLAQGYYFAKPNPTGAYDSSWLLNELHMLHNRSLYDQTERNRGQTQKKLVLKNMLIEASKAIAQGIDFKQATHELLQHHAVERIYLLNSDGVQIVESLIPDHLASMVKAYAPLSRSDGALWARRAYFRNAMEHPDQVQISTAYIGLPNASLNITFSKVLTRIFSAEKNVLCVDVSASFLNS
ncbi:EAL domain-containing protein [Thiomicrospira sp. ALE5]|uniref:sensor domain-containing phosphodiesterase n=1 Tax=Thiomicrospira sp. ALE5 TaxID=748650 RepID=UPI0008E519B8|nr:EAL domain-containing protein [Thiomicrospira sp. ALE5]SFR49981.1 EAL domain, c-di-GMP-specific phosphodiesterase class I (or its enzymatically inactive variant) [Thiomicrospira sp. ALE5]